MKIKNTLLTVMILVPSLVLAGHGEHHEVTMFNSDFFYRVLNFTIFAGLIYYLAANPIKAFFADRAEGISNQLKEIEDKLQASKNDRITAEENLLKAEEKAKELVADAGAEAKIMSSSIADKNEVALKLLTKQLEDKQVFERTKATRDTINTLLDDGFENDDINVDATKVVSLVSKKVA